jgi:hypothetical protein
MSQKTIVVAILIAAKNANLSGGFAHLLLTDVKGILFIPSSTIGIC